MLKHFFLVAWEPNKRAVGCGCQYSNYTHLGKRSKAIFEPLEPLNANDTLTLWQCERVQFSLIWHVMAICRRITLSRSLFPLYTCMHIYIARRVSLLEISARPLYNSWKCGRYGAPFWLKLHSTWLHARARGPRAPRYINMVLSDFPLERVLYATLKIRVLRKVYHVVQFYLIAWDGARAHTTQCCSFMYFLLALWSIKSPRNNNAAVAWTHPLSMGWVLNFIATAILQAFGWVQCNLTQNLWPIV